MGNFNKGDGFSGNRKFKRGGSSDRPQMHSATCSECGKQCEVPFKPSGDKPVYCSECFSNKEGSDRGRSERRRPERHDRGEKRMFRAICDKCHKDCEVPFKPTGDKPVYCSDCFGKTEKRTGSRESMSKNSGASQNQKQFEMLNKKLDDIMAILSAHTATEKKVKKAKPAAKVVEEKAEVKKVVKKKATAKKPAKKTEKKVALKKVLTKKKVVAKKTVKKVAKKIVKKKVTKKK